MVEVQARKLEDRSYLKFYFPIEKYDFLIYTLPFYSNIKLEESKQANYVEYDILSRSSSLFTYLGAKAREFRLEFGLNLLHLIQESRKPSLFSLRIEDPKTKKTNKDIFFKKGVEGDSKRISVLGQVNNAIQKFGEANEEVTSSFLDSLFGWLREETDNKKVNYIETLLWWINLIRSSVLNNAMQPMYGPPIIKLSHGILYNSIPCICSNYAINVEDNVTYDLKTLMPLDIKIMMTLFEVRAGTFDTFVPGPVFGENNAGWEAILHQGTIDSYEEGLNRNG